MAYGLWNRKLGLIVTPGGVLQSVDVGLETMETPLLGCATNRIQFLNRQFNSELTNEGLLLRGIGRRSR